MRGMEIKVTVTPDGILVSDGWRTIGFTGGEQRELLAWFWQNKQALVLDTICKNCRERNDYHNYCENKAERGK